MSPRFGGGGENRAREQRERSAEERERAQQEREARRAAREGRAPRALPPLPREPPRAPAVAPSTPELGRAPAPGEDVALPPEPQPASEREPSAEGAPMVAPEPVPELEPESRPAAEVRPPPEPAPAPAAEPVPAPEPAASTAAFVPEPEPEPAATHADLPAHGASSASYPWAFDEPQVEEQPPVPRPAVTSSAHDDLAGEPSWAFDAPQRDDAAPRVVVQGRAEAPAGVTRVAGSSLASAAGAEGPPRFGAPPRGVPKRRRGARRVILLLILAGIAAVAFFLYRLYEPGADGGEGRVAVTVAPGSSAEQIGRLLARQDVVASSFFFSLRARMSGENLRSGKLSLKRGMSYEAALAELTKAPPAAPVLTKITLPEGPGRKELAARVKQAGFTGSYLKASRSSTALDPRDYGAPKSASLEGFLFPATYALEPRSSAQALVTQQVRTFKREFAKVTTALATRRKLSRYDVLIIASMIEREALVPKDRRLIAGVIYNRLEQGMPLGIDATIRFELENFSRPLRESELKRDTPYNTRIRTGLPPGPIGNPGLAAIQAAANPARNDFVYYVVKPCENGAHAFSSTNEKFLRDVAAYNAKRDELGGKDPSQC